MEQLVSMVSRVLFVIAFVLAGMTVLERLAILFFGIAVSKYYYYSPARLLDIAAVVLLFVIGLQLREIKISIRGKGSNM